MKNYKGIEIHLFIEYVTHTGHLKSGNTYSNATPFVNTIFGRPYVLNDKDIRNGLQSNSKGMSEIHIYFNRMVSSLVNSCNMNNTKISVTVFNSQGPVTLWNATDNISALNNCANEHTFFYRDNGGIVCAGAGIDYSSDIEELRKLTLKMKSSSKDKKHIILFVSELFPACHMSFEIKGCKEVFDKWKKDDMEFITLRLKNSMVDYKSSTGKKEMNYELYKELSTVPDWTREGDYERICFFLSQIGKKISSMNYS